jgi:ribonuclease J
VIPLGGLGEVGKNMTVFEIADQMRSSSTPGLAFPRDEHLGVDLILPDFGYLHDRDVPRGRPDARARGPRRRRSRT